MNFDFALLLVLLVLISALLCLLDLCFLAPRRRARAGGAGQPAARHWLFTYARSLFPIFLLVLVLRSFLFEPFRIPSASMMPTLLIGDFILVNKFVYGLRLPVLHTLIWQGERPRRGDVVVFRYPLDARVSYIKRVVGVPGDHIVYQDRRLYLNGQVVPQQVRMFPYTGHGSGIMMTGAELRSEFLAGGRHDILARPGVLAGHFEARVPAGHYFVLGDNRDNSRDSRVWGMVPEHNLIGRASRIWMSWDWKNWRSGFVAFTRIGDKII